MWTFSLRLDAEQLGQLAASNGDLDGTIKVDVHLGALSTSPAAKVEGRQVRNFEFDISELGGEARGRQAVGLHDPADRAVPA